MIPNDLEISSKNKFWTQNMQNSDFCIQFSYSFSNAQDQSPRRFVTEPPNLLPVRTCRSSMKDMYNSLEYISMFWKRKDNIFWHKKDRIVFPYRLGGDKGISAGADGYNSDLFRTYNLSY